MMLYCARCQDATLSIDLNGHPAHVCPQCALSMRTDTVRFIP